MPGHELTERAGPLPSEDRWGERGRPGVDHCRRAGHRASRGYEGWRRPRRRSSADSQEKEPLP